ncbi:hypothetical protein K8R78_07130 [bacterium]|nr:hypothetical protein [bacterium]
MTQAVLLIWLLVVGMLFIACDEAPPESDTAPRGDRCEMTSAYSEAKAGECGAMISEEDILLADRCTLCHGSERYETADHTVDEWLTVLDEMIARSAALTEMEKTALAELLAK